MTPAQTNVLRHFLKTPAPYPSCVNKTGLHNCTLLFHVFSRRLDPLQLHHTVSLVTAADLETIYACEILVPTCRMHWLLLCGGEGEEG